ncbi:MAG: YgiQ family radical SAM protein, partial [Defluviitaleaceae bacterium]|nr:YgiQ family radical SAM protein [Defluviitaleaceae bacterium]
MKHISYFNNLISQPDFLPMSPPELRALGHENPDFIIITGDAYVDHPSFGAAIIGKLLWGQGYSIGIISQPNIIKSNDFRIFGEPKLGFLVTSGNVDSMVNNYTSAKKRRTRDMYSPGGAAGARPDRALTAYCRKLRDIFGRKIPIIAGGIEASLRRLAHYDFWSDSIRKSVIIDSCADILVYGMGERAISEIAALLAKGAQISHLQHIDGIVYKTNRPPDLAKSISLPDFDIVKNDKIKFAQSFKIQMENADFGGEASLVEKYGNEHIIQNPPAKPLTTAE